MCWEASPSLLITLHHKDNTTYSYEYLDRYPVSQIMANDKQLP